MSDWIEWNGGECPVDGFTQVCVRLRDGSEKDSDARFYEWDHQNEISDIIAYRVLNETEDEPEMTIDQAVKELSEARERVAELEKFIADNMAESGITVSFDSDTQSSELNITDWRDLKPGDVIMFSGSDEVENDAEYVVVEIENEDYDYKRPIAIERHDDNDEPWPDCYNATWRFIRRP